MLQWVVMDNNKLVLGQGLSDLRIGRSEVVHMELTVIPSSQNTLIFHHRHWRIL